MKTVAMKAMILAAGLGTRFKPWTDKHPKALAVINGKTLLQRNIEYLQQAGIYEVVVNAHHFASQIVEAIDRHQGWGSVVTISDESEAVLETGGGLLKASAYLDRESFVLINVDVLTRLDLSAMIAAHQRERPLATIAVSERNTSRYFLFDERQTLCGWKNAKTGETRIARPVAAPVSKAFSGIHIIEPQIFSLIREKTGLSGKFSIVDAYLSLAETEIIKGFDHTGAAFVDVGKPEAVAIAEAIWK